MVNNLRFPGQYFDQGTGLYYNYHRYYDSKSGRYVRVDPIGFDGEDINLYRYVWNNPINMFDKDGLAGDGQRKWRKDIDDWVEKQSRCLGDECIYFNPPSMKEPPKGHSDFSGIDQFDWTKEDYGATSPFRDPERHFRPYNISSKDVLKAIKECNKNNFERAMHRLQDYYFHYKKGFRWNPSKGQYGHAGYDADNDPAAWNDANKDTEIFLKQWECKCK